MFLFLNGALADNIKIPILIIYEEYTNHFIDMQDVWLLCGLSDRLLPKCAGLQLRRSGFNRYYKLHLPLVLAPNTERNDHEEHLPLLVGFENKPSDFDNGFMTDCAQNDETKWFMQIYIFSILTVALTKLTFQICLRKISNKAILCAVVNKNHVCAVTVTASLKRNNNWSSMCQHYYIVCKPLITFDTEMMKTWLLFCLVFCSLYL